MAAYDILSAAGWDSKLATYASLKSFNYLGNYLVRIVKGRGQLLLQIIKPKYFSRHDSSAKSTSQENNSD